MEFLFNKVEDLNDWNFIKEKLQRRCLPGNIAYILRAPALKNICERLLLIERHWFSTSEILKYIVEMCMGIFSFSSDDFLLELFWLAIDYFTKKYRYLRNKCYKCYWRIKPFLNVIKPLPVYSPNYSFWFPPGWY